MINLCTLFHDDLGDVPLGVFEAVVTSYNPKTQKWIVKYDFDNELEAFDCTSSKVLLGTFEECLRFIARF